MKEVLKNVGTSLTIEDCERFYNELHLACSWNDGKDLTLEIEK